MSSGDESDNMDLSEGSSSGSDVSEWNEGTRAHDAVSLADLRSIFEDDPAAKEHSLAFRYSRVSRHYRLPADKPSSWVDTPVFALRV
jgi:hypothetical protein